MTQFSMRLHWLLLMGFVSAMFPALALARTWKDSTGKFSVEAELTKVEDGAVHLRKSDGQVVVVPLDRLSAADQKYAASKPASSKPTAKPEAPADVAKKPARPEPTNKRTATPKPATNAARPGVLHALTEEVLERRVSYQYDQTPLFEAAGHLAAQLRCPIILDARGIQDAGLDAKLPVAAQGKNERLAESLDKLLKSHKLAFVLQKEVLLITSTERAESILETRVYQLARPMPNADQLIQQIQARLAPKSWDSVGGPGSIAPFPPVALVVSQSQAVHRSLLQQFGELLRVPAQRAALARAGSPARGLSAIVSCEFIQVPLVDALVSLEGQAKIRFHLDEKAIEAVGVKKTTPITRNLKGMTLESVLRFMLGDLDLTWTPDGDGLLITTPEVADMRLVDVPYDVRDLLMVSRGDADGLLEVVTSTVAPTSWDAVGGPGSIKPGPGGLLQVKQTYQVHAEIGKLLAGLRAAFGR